MSHYLSHYWGYYTGGRWDGTYYVGAKVIAVFAIVFNLLNCNDFCTKLINTRVWNLEETFYGLVFWVFFFCFSILPHFWNCKEIFQYYLSQSLNYKQKYNLKETIYLTYYFSNNISWSQFCQSINCHQVHHSIVHDFA